jgi:hypothetical protein
VVVVLVGSGVVVVEQWALSAQPLVKGPSQTVYVYSSASLNCKQLGLAQVSSSADDTHQNGFGVVVVVEVEVVVEVVVLLVVVVGPDVVVVVARQGVWAVSQSSWASYAGCWQPHPAAQSFDLGDQAPPLFPCQVQPEPHGLGVVVVLVVVVV